MKFINKAILILVVSLVINDVRCRDGYSDQNNINMKQISSNEGEIEAGTSYSTNVVQSDPHSQSISSVNAQYQIVDDSNKYSDYERADRGRTRKVYRIKNPFHQQEEEEDINKQSLNVGSKDTDTGSTNQYAGMQYSLPPEEFLQQIRVESQYNQQQQLQQQQQQISTPAPNFGNTATPQPQYQYSTISSSSYNNGNQQYNLTPQLEPKYPPPFYNSHLNSYQYHNAHSFGLEAIQSTPSSVTLYLSTSSPNNQYITPSNNYVSSSSPLFLSSPANSPSYISTTLSNNPTGSPTYNNVHRPSSNVERDVFHYGTNSRDSNQNIYVNQYDNSANGVKSNPNMQQQFQNEMSSSTQIPVSSIYPDISRDNWQNSRHLSLNNVPNSRSEYTQASQQNLQSNYLETQQSSNLDNPSNDLHQIGSMQSANNLVLSFVQPDYQTFNDLKNREREMEPQNKREDIYSHGDYGWKLDGRKPLVNYDVNLPINYPNQQNNNYQADSSLNFSYRQIDNGKNYDNVQKSKYKTENTDAQEFAKSAAKAQENMKNQQETYLNNYSFHARYPQNIFSNAEPSNFMISNNNNNQNSFTNDNANTHVNGQSNLVTPSSYYFQNSRENIFDNKVKQAFDQDKVLQNIVKVDDSNSISNVEPQLSVTEANNRYISSNNSKGINNNLNQFVKPFSETYYKDKNMIYGPNTETKTVEVFPSEGSRRLEPSYENPKKYESNFNSLVYKPHNDLSLPSFQYLGQSNPSNTQSQNNIQQQPIQRSKNLGSSDSNYSLKLNDIPHWLQGMNNMHFSQLQNDVNQGIIPTGTPLLLNQNIESHQIDVAASILNKLIREKQMEMNSKLEYNPQRETLLPTINGIKVMNPYNLDLKMVTEILKGKISDINTSYRNQYNQPNPLSWDMSQLKQLLLKNDNAGQYNVINNGIGSPGSPFFEVDTSNRFPYQGIKYSRSQEEAETLVPITDSTHSHPIGAVIEQDDLENENREAMDSGLDETNNDDFSVETEDEKPKISPNYRIIGSRYRNPNSLLPERHSFQRKNPKIIIGEPYPLLKPPPIRILNGRSRNKFDINRRQRRNKYNLSRIVKREPLFEEESFNDDVKENVPTLLRPPPVAEDKSDITEAINS